MYHESHDIVVALALKYKGDWNLIYKGCREKEYVEEEYFQMMEKMPFKAVTLIDPEYPQFLKNVHHAPIVFFYYGDLSLLQDYYNNISVVGSRDCSEYGQRMTSQIVSDLAKKGYVIISGLAKGIDGIAHRAAIDSGGKTVAVLGCGIDYCYPLENLELYECIKKNHLLISEYPFDTPPQPSNFPFRNRIIAGISKTVLVTEAAQKSGTLVTATLALMMNADVMCVPYQAGINSECNHLIKDGAILVESADDVIEQMSGY